MNPLVIRAGGPIIWVILVLGAVALGQLATDLHDGSYRDDTFSAAGTVCVALWLCLVPRISVADDRLTVRTFSPLLRSVTWTEELQDISELGFGLLEDLKDTYPGLAATPDFADRLSSEADMKKKGLKCLAKVALQLRSGGVRYFSTWTFSRGGLRRLVDRCRERGIRINDEDRFF